MKLHVKMDITEWIDTQKERLMKNSEAYGEFGCHVCKLGGGKTPYSTLTVKFPWKEAKKTVSSHRFAYMLEKNCFELQKDMQVSHRCHNKRCITADHLSLEPEHVNKDRQICRGTFPVKCRSHPPYADCLI